MFGKTKESAPDPWEGTTHVIVGGAGFLGSHLCDAALQRGARVVAIDSLVTGSLDNIQHLLAEERFEFTRGDGAEAVRNLYLRGPGAVVFWSLAALASPVAYFTRPLETLWAGAEVHRAVLEAATDAGAKIVYASTSETYGDPEVHPQPESYWGNVNPLGLRACYDEGKRFGEAMSMVYRRFYGLDVRIARLFNTYGPRMATDDGRMVPAFLKAALLNEDMTVHDGGQQTRSLCYVDDLIAGLCHLADAPFSKLPDPPVVNLGNPTENTVREVAEACWKAAHGPDSAPKLHHTEGNPDDPKRRCPDITRARGLLGWEPTTPLGEGLQHTAEYLRRKLHLS